MEWLKQLNLALDYIEEHLMDDIKYEEAAKIACCSTFHFQRMFSYIAGIPLSEYIRRRRMTSAAFELQQNDVKVIDIALKYGYVSPTAFNRAFQSVHGVPPTAAKETGIMLNSYPPITFNISIKGDTKMDYKIEKKDEFRIVGFKMPLSKEVEKNFKEVPLFWQNVSQSGKIPKLCKLMNSEPQGVLGISSCMGDDTWEYYISVASNLPLPNDLPDLCEYTVPACTWAVFPDKGVMPFSIQELEKRIITEWLPASGYEYANAPDIEVYINADPNNSEFEVWLPIIKKS